MNFKITAELGAILLLLIFSFIYSGSEVAIFSITEIERIKISRQSGYKNNLLIKYLNAPEIALITILVGNMVVNLTASILGEQVAAGVFPHYSIVYSVFIMTFLILLFGEIIPKNFAASSPLSFSRRFINFIHLTNRVFYPLIYLLQSIIRKSENYKTDLNLSRDELVSAVEVSSEAGLDNTSITILKNLVDLIDKPVTDLMIPRSDIDAVNFCSPWEEIQLFINKTPHSNVIFFKENIDNIIGYAPKTELIGVRKKNLKSVLQEPLFIPESKMVFTLLGDLKEKGKFLAVVLDEFGGTTGILTIKDILDHIFIKDILIKQFISRKGKGVWEAGGETRVSEINNIFYTNLPPEAGTISGYIINKMGFIPKEGFEIFIEPDLKLTILKSDKRQINLVELRKIVD